MAETLVDELLRSAGNKVYRFGYEAVIQNLTQIDPVFDRTSEVGQQISSIPDFLVLNKLGQPFFIEVKFRSDPQWRDINILKTIEKFWKAKVILVPLNKPYFRLVQPPFFDDRRELLFENLAEDDDLNITTEDLERFEPLVERYFLKRAKQTSTEVSGEAIKER